MLNSWLRGKRDPVIRMKFNLDSSCNTFFSSHRRRYQCCSNAISLAGVALAGGSEFLLDFQERFVLGLRNDEENVCRREGADN